MNRFFSTLAILTMALVAIAICVRQTFGIRDSLGDTGTIVLIGLQSILAVGLIAAVAWLIRREYLRRGITLRRVRVEVVQPLRRLLSTVWS